MNKVYLGLTLSPFFCQFYYLYNHEAEKESGQKEKAVALSLLVEKKTVFV